MNILNKISWNSRNRHIDVEFFSVYGNHDYKGWGFDLLKITNNLKAYSLLKYQCWLPNGTNKNSFSWAGDILFLRTYLMTQYLNMEDGVTWNGTEKCWAEKKWHTILTQLFK